MSSSGDSLVGTSNMMIAKENGLTPIGTQAHEWVMFHGAIFGYLEATRLSLKNWVNVYHGELGIALSDTYTSRVFFDSFSMQYAKLFDGVRQDSGDPLSVMELAIAHYESLRIDPMSKSIVFSDGLNPEKAAAIAKACDGRINASFGIGTNLTNDLGVKALNIVIKMTGCSMKPGDWLMPTVKLSDSPGKYTTIDNDTLETCKKVLGLD